MNYELAKKLKDAGFPQMGNGFMLMLDNPELFEDLEDQSMSSLSRERYVFTKPEDRNKFGEDVYSPTLSELINECGGNKQYFQLRHEEGKWMAETSHKTLRLLVTWYAETPEEAVAHLWLKLNNFEPK